MVEYTMHEYWFDYPHFPPNPPLLLLKQLNKGKVLEAKIFGIFTPQLGLYTGKISLKSVRSIEHG
jgi:hypothetical protein